MEEEDTMMEDVPQDEDQRVVQVQAKATCAGAKLACTEMQ